MATPTQRLHMETDVTKQSVKNSNFDDKSCGIMEAELNDMRDLLSECDKVAEKILAELSWTKEEVIKEERTLVCPFNDGHRMKQAALEKHIKKCELKQKGYTNSEINEILDNSESAKDVNNVGNKRVVIDTALQEHIIGVGLDVPLTPDRIAVDLNREQRLAIYDYVISAMNDMNAATTTSQTAALSLTGKKAEEDTFLKMNLFDALKAKLENKTEPCNKWELLASQRDMKRRKQSYRKSVHTSRKSYNEIVREVIENHCSYLRSVFDERMKKENETKAKSLAKGLQKKVKRSDYKSSLADTTKSVASIRDSESNERSKRDDKLISKHSSHKHRHKHKHRKHKRRHEK